MKNYKLFVLIFSTLIIVNLSKAQQLNIINAYINPEDVSGMLVKNITISNLSTEFTSQIRVSIYTSSKLKLADAISTPVVVKKGLTIFNSSNIKLQTCEFSDSKFSAYLKSFHKLPSGSYIYCVTLNGKASSSEEDQYCDEVIVDNDFALALVSPLDGDVISNPNPILIWTHSDPFNEVTSNVFYKIVLVEKGKNQTNESAIISNPVLFIRNNLLTHTVYYPLNAPELISGKLYSWQVQKISNGKIINQTEAWTFSLAAPTDTKDIKYAVMSKASSSTYFVNNGKFYFKFDEEYQSTGKLKIKLTSPENKDIPVTITNDGRKGAEDNFKQAGYNSYLLDVEKLNLKPGIYLLEAFNEMNEKFKLSFKVE